MILSSIDRVALTGRIGPGFAYLQPVDVPCAVLRARRANYPKVAETVHAGNRATDVRRTCDNDLTMWYSMFACGFHMISFMLIILDRQFGLPSWVACFLLRYPFRSCNGGMVICQKQSLTILRHLAFNNNTRLRTDGCPWLNSTPYSAVASMGFIRMALQGMWRSFWSRLSCLPFG